MLQILSFPWFNSYTIIGHALILQIRHTVKPLVLVAPNPIT